MKIVYATLFYPPERNAGTENYTRDLAAHLAERGHEVHVACAAGWESGDNYVNGVTEETDRGVTVHRLRLNWTLAGDPNRGLYDSVQAEDWFSRLLQKVQPDVVHVTSSITLGVGVLRAAHLRGIPLILTLMDFWFACPKTILIDRDGRPCDGLTTDWECQECLLQESGAFRTTEKVLPESLQSQLWKHISVIPYLSRRRGARGLALNIRDRRAMLQETLSYPHRILSHSQFVRRIMHTIGLSKRVEYLPNGHDLSWVNSLPVRNASDRTRFAYLGQLEPLKGVDLLIEAFMAAGLDGLATLDIWGGPARTKGYAQRLESLTENRDDIVLHGRFERHDLPEILSRADVVVVPSRWYENSPLVIQEAFAAKTPVVATNLGGMAEVVRDEHDGLLFPLNDLEGLARQMKRLTLDRSLAERLRGNIGPVKTLDQECDELERVYEQAMEDEGAEMTLEPAQFAEGLPR